MIPVEIIKQFPHTTEYTNLRGLCAIYDGGVIASSLVPCIVALIPKTALDLRVHTQALHPMFATRFCPKAYVKLFIAGELAMMFKCPLDMHKGDRIDIDDPEVIL